jgi:ankyrin repeat protein
VGGKTKPDSWTRADARTLEQILASCSETLFPAQFGAAPVALNTTDCNGDTPLHVMLWREDREAALMLIAAGADVNAVGDMSETPLHVAVRWGDAGAIEALLKAGANPEAVSEFGETPRSIAIGRGIKLGR